MTWFRIVNGCCWAQMLTTEDRVVQIRIIAAGDAHLHGLPELS